MFSGGKGDRRAWQGPAGHYMAVSPSASSEQPQPPATLNCDWCHLGSPQVNTAHLSPGLTAGLGFLSFGELWSQDLVKIARLSGETSEVGRNPLSCVEKASSRRGGRWRAGRARRQGKTGVILGLSCMLLKDRRAMVSPRAFPGNGGPCVCVCGCVCVCVCDIVAFWNDRGSTDLELERRWDYCG